MAESLKTHNMKKIVYVFASLVITFSLFSCGGETEEVKDEEPAEEQCLYSYNEGSTKLEWTAYKTTGKVPVAGSFNEIEVSSEDGDDPVKVLESLSFSINTTSVETNNEERNGKIAEHFFKTINTNTIEGKVKSVADGKATIAVTMNGVTFDVVGSYTLEGADFSFTSSIDVSSWNGMPGIEALNKICKDLHTGEDGVSKLWSEVGLSFSTTLKSTCK